MTDTFRALCAELLDVIDGLPCETNYRNESRCVFPIDEDVVFRARAALAEPEPEPDDPDYFLAWILFACDGKLRPEAQRVLAAYGIAQPEPVPVSERLPRPEDCNEMGQFYAWDGNYWWMTGMAAFDETAPYVEGYTHWLPHWALPVPAQHS